MVPEEQMAAEEAIPTAVPEEPIPETAPVQEETPVPEEPVEEGRGGEEEDVPEEGLFIPAGAGPDTQITPDLTFGQICESLGINPNHPKAWQQARKAMGSEALPEMDAHQFMFYNAYIDLWEEEPPQGYIEGAMSEGMNVKEFIKREKQKPGWEDTPAYAAEEEKNVGVLEDLLANGDTE